MENNRQELAECISALVEAIDPIRELDGLCALLCAVGAACYDETLEAKLIEAISPIMANEFMRLIGRNN